MFWVVQSGAIAATLVLMFIFRNAKQRIHLTGKTEVRDYFPTYLLIVLVLILILASFIPDKSAVTNGLVCMSLFIIGIIRETIRKRSLRICVLAFKEIDYFTILLLLGLFVVIGGVRQAGVIDDISRIFVKISGNNVFVIYTLLVWASVLLSAIIDNIPYVATMLPVVSGIAGIMNIEPYVLYFGLLSGATLGGNLTPIGASANIAGLGILRKHGYEVKTSEFMRIGVPFTLAAVITGYVLVWLIWK